MKISREWLSDFVEFDDLSNSDFSELITTRVAEVDEISVNELELDKLQVALVRSVRPHPNSERLKLATISTSNSELELVCGAANCKEGILVPFAPTGSKVLSPSGDVFEVSAKEVAGVESRGMLLSEAEAGLGSETSGLMILDQEIVRSSWATEVPLFQLEPGTPLSKLFPAGDTILDIDNKSLTHRPDLWSHFGFARELSALLGRPLLMDFDRFSSVDNLDCDLGGKSKINVEVETGSGCRRFAAFAIEGVRNEPSPLWMRRRLASVGVGVRGILVDLSNYVMCDIGQPNHAYDRNLVSTDRFSIRNAKSDEELETLDGEKLKLTTEDLVVTNGERAIALGGVIGGSQSSIQATTNSLLFESGNFDPLKVRKSAKRYNLRTDASNRFEKSQSADSVPLACERFLNLIKSIQPDCSVDGGLADCYPEKPRSVRVAVSYEYVRNRLGAPIQDEDIDKILSGLGFECSSIEKGEGEIGVPYYRATRDVSIEDDLVEEVGRIYGYENIPESAPRIVSDSSHIDSLAELQSKFADSSRAFGFSEVSSYSFMSSSFAAQNGFEVEKALKVRNAVDSELDLIRTSIVPGLLSFASENAKHQSAVAIFEMGSCYLETKKESPNDNGAQEIPSFSILFGSDSSEETGSELFQPAVSQGQNFYSLLAVVKRLVVLAVGEEPNLELIEDSRKSSWQHPFRTAKVVLGDTEIGLIAEVNPSLNLELPKRTVVAELNLGKLMNFDAKVAEFKSLTKFPQSFFEMSIVMPKKESYSKLDSLVREAVADDYLKNLEVLSVFEGEQLGESRKSISVKVTLGADDRTLSSDELSAFQNQLMSAVENSDYELRA